MSNQNENSYINRLSDAMNKYVDLLNKITSNTQVVVLTGAGISAESGVPTFRGKGSMWENKTACKLVEKSNPPWTTQGTWEYYEWRRQLVATCKPNMAHKTLVDMEQYFTNFNLITQNVDELHQRAGSQHVIELHGNMWKGRCPMDDEIVDLPNTPLKEIPPIHRCGHPLRPHVIQFGENLDIAILNKAASASRQATLFFVIGTSGIVHPAAQLPILAKENRANVIEINKHETPITPHSNVSIHGKAAKILPTIWKEIKE